MKDETGPRSCAAAARHPPEKPCGAVQKETHMPDGATRRAELHRIVPAATVADFLTAVLTGLWTDGRWDEGKEETHIV